MKKILKIVCIALIPTFTLSCVTEEGNDPGTAHSPGLLQIEVATAGADEHDRIHQVRFLVFDNASFYPRLDVNHVITLEEKDRDAKVFSTTLKVMQNNDKMIIVVINEPANLTPALEQVAVPSHAEELMFAMVDAFSPDCTEPIAGGMPMSGVKRGVSVTGETPEPITVSVERSVARVELWLKTEPGVTAEINGLTRVNLRKSHHEGYLATGTVADGTRFQTGENARNNFGRMLDIVDPKEYIAWAYGGEQPMPLDGTLQKIVIFYLPERLCDALNDTNKAVLELRNIATSEGYRDVDIVLHEFAPDGSTVTEPITMMRRNYIYRISGRVTSKDITFSGMVAPWTEENIDLEIED